MGNVSILSGTCGNFLPQSRKCAFSHNSEQVLEKKIAPSCAQIPENKLDKWSDRYIFPLEQRQFDNRSTLGYGTYILG